MIVHEGKESLDEPVSDGHRVVRQTEPSSRPRQFEPVVRQRRVGLDADLPPDGDRSEAVERRAHVRTQDHLDPDGGVREERAALDGRAGAALVAHAGRDAAYDVADDRSGGAVADSEGHPVVVDRLAEVEVEAAGRRSARPKAWTKKPMILTES